MKNLIVAFALLLALLFSCSSNKLAQYELKNATIAAHTFMPPREPLSPRIFGLAYPVENVLDAIALSQLSVGEMSSGLEYLANFTAERISEKLSRFCKISALTIFLKGFSKKIVIMSAILSKPFQ